MNTPSGGQGNEDGRTSSGRRLVLCLDGTNNEYAATNTNVVKLYAMVDESGSDQLAYYQPGIETFAPPGVCGKAKVPGYDPPNWPADNEIVKAV